MKAVQVVFDESLLQQLDEDEEVRRVGRSAFLRRVVGDYLETRRRKKVATQYQRAYGTGDSLKDFEGWESQGEWPPE